MNKENFDIAIKVMLRVAERQYAFYVTEWQILECCIQSQAKTDEESLRDCGMAACFGGWLAVSPEFQDAGGSCNRFDGYPVYKGRIGSHAIEEFLGIDESTAKKLCCEKVKEPYGFYGCGRNKITAQMVAEKLIDIRDNPEKYGIE
jgi:hypothetical protein